MSRQFTPHSSLDGLKKEAKRWLKALRSNDPEARARLLRVYPKAPPIPGLRDVQHALAREHGLEGWSALLLLAPAPPTASHPTLQQYDEKANALLDAFRTGTPAAMERHWNLTCHRRAWQGMRTYVLLDLGRQPDTDISLEDAQLLVAREHGFENWAALTAYVGALPTTAGAIAAKPVALVAIDDNGTRRTVARERSWDTVIDVMREKRIPALNADGQMTDAALERLSHLDHIVSLDLSGSTQLTDTGLRYLARMPRLQHLNLGGTSIGDLESLRHLVSLKTLTLYRTRVTDAEIRHLARCEQLERIDLSGTQTGDGAIAALAGKQGLCHFHSGNAVTDAGAALLHEFPVFKTWRGGDTRMALLDFNTVPNYLALRGSFTNTGAAALVGLDGLFALNLDDSKLAITADCLAPLVQLPKLGWLSFDADDDAMPYIATLPNLRYLLCQDTVAGDDGFVALSSSRSIEHIWGRRCHNLKSRGFAALATMPSLRALSVSCKNVDDSALATLPEFPALRDLMPMDVPDEGYRHIGRCDRLEALLLMYCRETTDRATEHITGLASLKKYFASYTGITNRTPELLSGIASLEEVEFSGCAGLTNEGVAALARLPRIRELRASGMANVTPDIAPLFPAGAHIEIDA